MSLQSQLHSSELSPEAPRQLDPEIGPEMVEVSKAGIPEGLVPADQLPSGAAMLAQLFPAEEAPVARSSGDMQNPFDVLHGSANGQANDQANDQDAGQDDKQDTRQDGEDFRVEAAENWLSMESALEENAAQFLSQEEISGEEMQDHTIAIDLPLVAGSPDTDTIDFEKGVQSNPALSETSSAEEIDLSPRDSNRPRRRLAAPNSVFAGIALRVKKLLNSTKSNRGFAKKTSQAASEQDSQETQDSPAVVEAFAPDNSPKVASTPSLSDFPNAVADAVAAPLEILADAAEPADPSLTFQLLSALENTVTVVPFSATAMASVSEDVAAGAADGAIHPIADSLAHTSGLGAVELQSEAFPAHPDHSVLGLPLHLESSTPFSSAPGFGSAHNPGQNSLPDAVPNSREHFEPSLREFAANEAIESIDAVEATETVDTSDDDLAIASAIERYANITDPPRFKSPELSGNRGISEHEQANAIEPPAPSHEKQHEEEQVDLNVLLGIERDITAGDPVLPPSASSIDVSDGMPDDMPDIGQSPAQKFVSAPFARESAPEQPLPVEFARTASQQESPEQTLETPSAIPYRDWSFEEKLASHHEWLESKGKTGKKADFAEMDLEGTELIGVDLRYLDLHDANLRATDLLMADLRDACLARANFRDACLVGANLEGANLEGATLDSAMGLVPRQLAGANLHDAALPAHILAFDALAEFRRASSTVQGFFTALMSLSVFSWLIVWMTKDFQLLTNSAILPFLHSSTAATAMPTQQFYLIAPFGLFIVYLVFHFHLQRLWDLALELPAVFPDGRALAENEPRIVLSLLRTHFRWMNQDAPSTRIIEKSLAVLIAYWVVPATLFLYWLRFLTLQNVHGTVLQMFLVAGAAGAALYSTTKTGKPAEAWTLQENTLERMAAKCKEINPVTAALVVLGTLAFLSAGTIAGVPHGKERAPQFMSASIRRWAPSVLWAFGVDPYADITESVISTKPANWNGSDEQVSSVKGARLNDSNFRYAQAYRVFLANAHLLHAKFQGAFLSQADLRGADLGQSDLRYAILDQSMLTRANLDRAVLDGANLSRADIHAANLSYASLAGATLVDARLDGATLYGAKLPFATLIRTNFEKADLRESHLEGANLEHANMQAAYLWSAKLPSARLTNAQLATAIFVDVNLRGADLRWAQLHGTVLTGADLTGALLDGADFRGAVGFGPAQICSAKSRLGLLLDDPMQAQVTAQCGAAH